ncbi:MAG: VWA-like domain-containing protein [candidate division WOR-3 bacterium]
MNKDAIVRVRLAIARAIEKFPFMVEAFLRLRLVRAVHMPGVMATDKFFNLYINEDLLDAFSDAELISVVFHEVLHNVLLHFKRLKRYPVFIANIAADLEINQCYENYDIVVPNGAILPEMLGLKRGEIAEYYAEELMKAAKAVCFGDCFKCKKHLKKGYYPYPENGVNLKPSFGLGSSAHGRKAPWEKFDHQDKSENCSESELDSFAERIYNESKIAGSLPGFLERSFNQATSSKINWQRELLLYLRAVLEDVRRKAQDYTRLKLSKKSYYTNMIYPGTTGFKLTFGILVDTSGSMTEDELSSIMEEIKNLLVYSGFEAIVWSGDTLITTVTAVKKWYELGKVRLVGGGGTAMDSCLKEIAESKIELRCVLVFTDGYTSWNDSNPFGKSTPVVVVLTNPYTREAIPKWVSKTIIIPKTNSSTRWKKCLLQNSLRMLQSS